MSAASSTSGRDRRHRPDAGPEDVKQSIKHAFERNAKLDAKNLTVESANGTAILEGTVSSWPEHDEAIAAAWAAPGVRDVDDQLRVSY